MHFRAFISYSHQDESWARWLQKSLEAYRVPTSLVGTDGAFGPIPADLKPVFRDREDLSSSPDLSDTIRSELAASESLIVICSPSAARSKWVNKEIRYFRELGRGNRVFALIVAGDPDSDNHQQNGFPPALLVRDNGDSYQPLAADVRPYADGKTLAKLKIIAGILGIRLDDLRRRDQKRRRKNWFTWGLVASILIAVTAWLALSAITSQKAAEMQRAGTEDLLSFMLGDLESLEPIVGLEVIDDSDPSTKAYRLNAGFDQMSDQQLSDSAMGWREEGQQFHDRGQLDNAMQRFQLSRAALIDLYQRDAGRSEALFELGQAEFWVGYVYMDQGELDKAQASFTRYGAITRRLVNADPNNAELVMELAQSMVNLSALEQMRQYPDHANTLKLRQTALQYTQIALVLDPGNRFYKQELSTIMAFVADAWLETCNLGKAFQFRQENVAISRSLYLEQPEDDYQKLELAYALSGLAVVQKNMALTRAALQSLQESRGLIDQLLTRDPENQALRWQKILRDQRIAWLRGLTGETREAFEEIRSQVEAFGRATDDGDYLKAVDQARFRINYSVLAHRLGHEEDAQEALGQAMDKLVQLVNKNPENRVSRFQLARAVFEHWVQTGQQPPHDVSESYADFTSQDQTVSQCDELSLAARLAVMNHDSEQARVYIDTLLGKGFYEPEFSSFCREYDYCE